MKNYAFFIAAILAIGCSSNDELNKEEYPVFEEKHKTHTPDLNNPTVNSVEVKNSAHFHTIEIKQMKFLPAELTLQSGDTVMWINNDFVLHDVTEENKKRWTSAPIATGESWSKIVTESAEYFCSLHVLMKGKLTVE